MHIYTSSSCNVAISLFEFCFHVYDNVRLLTAITRQEEKICGKVHLFCHIEYWLDLAPYHYTLYRSLQNALIFFWGGGTRLKNSSKNVPRHQNLRNITQNVPKFCLVSRNKFLQITI